MSQIGAVPFSFKGDQGWRGMTTTSKSLPFHFDLLENCYVSGDGSEIRTFPGYVCMVDPVSHRDASVTNTTLTPRGYECTHIDARRPVSATASTTYLAQIAAADVTSTLYIWNRATTIHGVEQVRGRWVFFGEGGDRFEPIYNNARNAWTYVASYDDNGSSVVKLTLNAAPSTTADTHNAIQVGRRIYLEGLTGTLAATLNGKSHRVTAVSGSDVTISTSSGGAISAVTGQTGMIAMVSYIGNPASVDDSSTVSDDQESLMSWTTIQRGDTSLDPIDVVYPAHVANRQRDFADQTGTNSLLEGNSKSGSADYGRSRRRQLSLPYRLVPHVAGSRLVLAAPGYGCVFQVPVVLPADMQESSNYAGVKWIGNDVYDKPRVGGVPKAVQFEGVAKTSENMYAASSSTYSFGGTGEASRAGTYKFKFAYKDESTGEVGLCSEPITLTTDTTTYVHHGLRMYVMFPGYMMSESMAMSINVYRTAKGGDTFYYDRTIPSTAYVPLASATPSESAKYGTATTALGASVTVDSYWHHVVYDAVYSSDDTLKKQDGYVPDVLEQMPMGCKAARTIRGWTFYGGALGNSGPLKEMWYGTATLEYDTTAGTGSVNYNSNELTFKYSDVAHPPFEGMESSWGCGQHWLPPAYQGQVIFSRRLFPYPRQAVQLNKLVSTVSGGSRGGRVSDIRYSILDTPVRSTDKLADTVFRNQDAWLALPRGRIQISEPDNPFVTPATNTTIVANERDEDVEAIGTSVGQAVICTRSKTYMLGFTNSPVGVSPEISNERFGCIAPNSMVEFDGGCAWISDRGPVAMMGGSVTPIGESLERLFYGETSRYLRDFDGMMRHSWACHDAERGLLYFGVFANRAVGTAYERTVSYRGSTYTWAQASSSSQGNQIKSRFPCDEVLVYSYKVGAWSVWRPPLSLGIQWMCRGLDDLGNNRVWFLGDDKRLYTLDDAYGQFDRESNILTLSTPGSTTTVTTTTGIKIRAGMTAAFYTSTTATTPAKLIGVRTVTSTTSTTFTVDSAVVVPQGGCKVIVGPHVATIRTTFNNWKKGERIKLGKVGLRSSLWSRYMIAGAGDVQTAFVSATVKTGEKRDQIKTSKTGSLTTDGSYTYTQIVDTGSEEQVWEQECALGEVSGVNHQVEVQIVSGAQVRISDLYAELK